MARHDQVAQRRQPAAPAPGRSPGRITPVGWTT